MEELFLVLHLLLLQKLIFILQPHFLVLWGLFSSFQMLWKRPHEHQGEWLDLAEGGITCPGVFLLLLPLGITDTYFSDLACLWLMRCDFPFSPACSQCSWPWGRERLEGSGEEDYLLGSSHFW